jgi:3'-phosphoadenosine 5'-phosphosulfate sulfotransferase (PAPS reductase)/FAD synthetase
LRHIVALSGGKDSTALALRLAEVEPQDYEYVITPTGDELPEMFEHWRRLGELLGKPLRPLAVASLPRMIRETRTLPNWRMRWCTRRLKIEPFLAFVAGAMPCTVYVGLRADEEEREGVTYKSAEVTQRFPLREWGWGVVEVKAYLAERGIEIPRRTDCGMCFFQTLGEWYRLWQEHPDRWEEYEKLEDLTGHTLRSDGRDTWPASLRELRARFEAGDVPRVRASMSDRKIMCSTCAR